MTAKPATAFYATSIEHKDLSGHFMGSFAIPGLPPQWVTKPDGQPRHFRTAVEAELAAFRVLLSKLNRARDEQRFQTKRDAKREKAKNQIVSYHAPEPSVADRRHTVESVFGQRD
jgi:hypothetical protein